MVRMVELLNSVTESDTIFIVLVVILIVTSLAMVYLIYEQNKEMKEEYIRRAREEKEDEAVNIKVLKEFESIKDKEANERNEDSTFEDTREMEVVNPPLEPEPDLVSLTTEEIPDKLEYTQALWLNDSYELESIRKELQNAPKDSKVTLTPYEEEQESKAIISYDELVDASKKKHEEVKESQDEFIPIVKANKNNKYYHEEEFLYELKELKSRLG